MICIITGKPFGEEAGLLGGEASPLPPPVDRTLSNEITNKYNIHQPTCTHKGKLIKIKRRRAQPLNQCSFNSVDIDECSSDPCHSNATCNNTIGSFTCTCVSGYSGDGFQCIGKLVEIKF